jgi:FkbM family methyltransferase
MAIRAIADTIEKVARKAGILVAPAWRTTQIDEEQHMRRLLKYLDVDCVFDVGANVGQYAEKLRRYSDFRGRILSFEPNPAAFAKLQAKAAGDPLWDVFPIALGAEEGTAVFQAYDDSLLGSFLQFDATSRHSPTHMGQKAIEVQVKLLSEYFPVMRERYCFERPFLKLDTQGFDLQVAIGAGPALREFLGIQSEVAFAPIYKGASKFDTVVSFYQANGFVMSRLFPNNDVHFPELVEMDVALVRADKVRR